ncbi:MULTISPECIES: hypothetical protein [Glycomyces]|uniref:Uncharacterized protein n=1 Tax=Glycomyces lechevalierae TaxID=256034 RepID=A0A9X3SY89_9ACTN|nr:hypothetical protein [Glycomyces lechevalierae]MDA1387797.1 hypothetical protein [Glycomyces lechevalierae]MDR7337430.1 hypothetical protein [Glycomyces lechevalierae]
MTTDAEVLDCFASLLGCDECRTDTARSSKSTLIRIRQMITPHLAEVLGGIPESLR